MSTYKFSLLVNNQHQLFNPGIDKLSFDLISITASAVRLTQSGANLGFSYGSKTIWLDSVGISQLSTSPNANVTFANGSLLAIGDGTSNTLADYYGQDYTDLLSTSTVGNQVWGLGGADYVQTGSGADLLVGNSGLTSTNHVSRAGTVGGNQSSDRATISADGNFVAFEGSSTNLIAGHVADINIKNMSTGIISNEAVSAAGLKGNSGQGFPVISADGLWVAFQGNSSNLIPGSAPSGTIYVASTTTNSIEAVNTTAGNGFADRAGSDPDISGDGRYVVFSSSASNLATGSNTDYSDVFVKDRQTGEVLRISTSTSGGDGNGDSQYAKISADGRLVVFQSFASNLTANDNNKYPDIFVWDRNDNSLTNLTKDSITNVISNPNNGNYLPDIAYDSIYGGAVVFQTGRNLVAQDTSNATDIYSYNLFYDTLQLVSSKADGTGVSLGSEDASVSGDGRFVVFTSYSDELVPGDTNGTRDIFVKDLFTGQIALVSKTAGGLASNGPSMRSQISLGGEWIVFESSATNLSSTDANGSFPDVFRVSNPLLKDTLIGGAGNDTYVLARADIVQEQVNGGIDTIQSSISYSLVDTDGSGTLGGNVENLTLTGTSNLSGTGNALNNIITGNVGNNVLNGGAGIDTVSYSQATAAVTVSLALTTAQATGGAGSDTLINFENLTGSGLADTLTGNAGNNRLDGGLGNDILTGGVGNDTYIVNSSADVINEISGAGTDTVVSSITWTLLATLENLTLSGIAAISGTGNQAANLLTGNAAANTLNGYAGNDTLSGGVGNDILIGGAGNDKLTGGAGNDIFYINSALNATTNLDTITDYSVVDDTIRLENGIMTGLGLTTGLLTVGAFHSGTVNAATQTHDRIIYNTSTGGLFYDADGSGAASAAVEIAIIGATTHAALTNADFVII
jgi:hypothetical protein